MLAVTFRSGLLFPLPHIAHRTAGLELQKKARALEVCPVATVEQRTMQYNPRVGESDITQILRKMDETLARLKNAEDDETHLALGSSADRGTRYCERHNRNLL